MFLQVVWKRKSTLKAPAPAAGDGCSDASGMARERSISLPPRPAPPLSRRVPSSPSPPSSLTNGGGRQRADRAGPRSAQGWPGSPSSTSPSDFLCPGGGPGRARRTGRAGLARNHLLPPPSSSSSSSVARYQGGQDGLAPGPLLGRPPTPLNPLPAAAAALAAGCLRAATEHTLQLPAPRPHSTSRPVPMVGPAVPGRCRRRIDIHGNKSFLDIYQKKTGIIDIYFKFRNSHQLDMYTLRKRNRYL